MGAASITETSGISSGRGSSARLLPEFISRFSDLTIHLNYDDNNTLSVFHSKTRSKSLSERLQLLESNRLTWFMVVLSFLPVYHYPTWLPPLRAGRLGLVRCGIAEPSGQPAPLGQKTKYEDGFLEKAFMMLFARKMEKFAAPIKEKKRWFDYDYDSFVDVSKRVMQGRSRVQQQEVVREVLLSMLPPGAPAQFRKLFPPTKWAAEFNAALTVPFFHWLVGPSEVVEVEIDGVKQKSGVRIKKCRYLENSGCVGMCVNMCKIPTQDFFTNEFGLPLTMIPNFEDMSCDMVYGQVPPPFEEDPVAKQPCYADICSMANPNAKVCPTLQA